MIFFPNVYLPLTFHKYHTPQWIQLRGESARAWRGLPYRRVSRSLRTNDRTVTYSSSIVAIHGLDGHREASFTAPNGILWLRDLLPKTLPKARILTYGYDARTRGVNRSNQVLYDLSIDFVAKLSSFRVHTNTDVCD